LGWFRRHLQVDSELLGMSMAMEMQQSGAAEVYLDGRLLARFGTLPTTGVAERAYLDNDPFVFTFSSVPDHVVAVRYACSDPARFLNVGEGAGFRLTILEATGAIRQRSGEVRTTTALQTMFTALGAFLALFHLALFAYRPAARENLYCSLCMFAFALLVYGDFQRLHTTSAAQAILFSRLQGSLVPAVVFFGLMTYYVIRQQQLPRSWLVFGVAGAMFAVGGFLWPNVVGARWYLYFVAMAVEVVRLEVGKPKAAGADPRVFLGTMGVLGLAAAYQALLNLGVARPIAGVTSIYAFGLLALGVSMSFEVVRKSARTSEQLERKLVEVQKLSAQVVDQEREASRRELQQRLLEAENARRGRELESARALQISMLPTSLPAVPGLEIAARMVTAAEVGGDYYDFRPLAGGGLLVAVGDATGHGVAAGIVVTVIKTMFAALGDQEDLAGFLGRCSRILRDLNTGPVHMCLALARVTTGSVCVCSAGMPPLLIRRAASGTIEEVVTGGLPLGSRIAGSYQEQRVALGAGDTLVFASDGLAEQMDGKAQPFGSAAVERAMQKSSGDSPRAVVERLLGAVDEWRGEREQDDDITVLGVRVSGGD
jgi:serine phosphatase RsbU (regulator of sigma subunit)